MRFAAIIIGERRTRDCSHVVGRPGDGRGSRRTRCENTCRSLDRRDIISFPHVQDPAGNGSFIYDKPVCGVFLFAASRTRPGRSVVLRPGARGSRKVRAWSNHWASHSGPRPLPTTVHTAVLITDRRPSETALCRPRPRVPASARLTRILPPHCDGGDMRIE